MNVMVSAVSIAVFSLCISASNAQSQDRVAEPMPPSSASHTSQQGEPGRPSRPDELPDLPQVTPLNSGGPLFPRGMRRGQLIPQTFHDKFMAYAYGTVGPRALLAPGIPAGFRMAHPPSHYPREWRQGAAAFGRNYGDQLATLSAFQTGRFAVSAALHEDLRYQRSTSANILVRAGHAFASTLVDRSDDGHARLALANFAGLAAGSYVGMSYLPSGFNDVTHADQRLAVRLGGLAGSNLGAEFGPDLFHFAKQHHLPRPKLPIPEWWTGW